MVHYYILLHIFVIYVFSFYTEMFFYCLICVMVLVIMCAAPEPKMLVRCSNLHSMKYGESLGSEFVIFSIDYKIYIYIA